MNRDYAIGAGHFKQNMADPLLRTAVPFGVVCRTGDDRNMLLAAHPFWYTERKWEQSDDPLGDEDWMGISPFCRTVHWENAAVLLYDLPRRDPYQGAAGKGSPLFLSERGEEVIQSAFVYVPETVDEKTETPAGFLIREGDVYVAIRPLAHLPEPLRPLPRPGAGRQRRPHRLHRRLARRVARVPALPDHRGRAFAAGITRPTVTGRAGRLPGTGVTPKQWGDFFA